MDDHAENNIEELQLLTELGFVVTAVPSTAAALQMLEGSAINLVISDMDRDGAPDAGVTLVSAMRRAGIMIPVMIYRGQQDNLSDEARTAGALDVVTSPRELSVAIRNALVS